MHTFRYGTGLGWLDAKTGGIRTSQFWVLDGLPKSRKSSVVRNLVTSFCRAGAIVNVFTPMCRAESWRRALWAMLSAERLLAGGNVDGRYLTENMIEDGTLTDAQRQAVCEASDEIANWNLCVYGAGERTTSWDQIRRLCEAARRWRGLEIIILDSLDGLLESDEYVVRGLQDFVYSTGTAGLLVVGSRSERKPTEFTEDWFDVRGINDLAGASDNCLRVSFTNQQPDQLRIALVASRRAYPGMADYIIHPPTGLILREVPGSTS